jgi:hypothetical protein
MTSFCYAYACVFDGESGRIVRLTWQLFKRAYPDAVFTASIVFRPEVEAFLGVDVPLVFAAVIGDGEPIGGRLARADGTRGALFGTPRAACTELGNAELDGLFSHNMFCLFDIGTNNRCQLHHIDSLTFF